MLNYIPIKWKLTTRVLPVVAIVVAAKLVAHYLGVEPFSLSPLFGAIISANVFLIGFLISGVLTDYKESEKLPGELACALEAMADEAAIIAMNKKDPEAGALVAHIRDLIDTTLAWFHKRERTGVLMGKITALNPHFLAVEPLTQANFIVRMKQEQSAVRRLVTRIHTIRETDFNPSAYAIAEIISMILTIGLIFTNIEPYYESLFFLAFVSFVQSYMVRLIHDLDNPFEYYSDGSMIENVSLKPLNDLQARLAAPAIEAQPKPATDKAAAPIPTVAQAPASVQPRQPAQAQQMRRKKR